jgi:translocation and assembly module TamB
LPVVGALSGTVRIAKHGATTFDVKIADLAPASQPGILRNMTLSATGKSSKTGADVKLALADRGRTSFRAAGRVPFGADAPLALTVDGSADLALANAYLSVGGDRARGLLTTTARVTGTRNAPRIEGAAKIANGHFRSAESGFELRNIEAVLASNERQIAITSLAASAPNGGKFTGQGGIRLEPLNGYPLSLNVKASNAQIASTELTTVVADVDARMTGSLTGQTQIAGTATLDRWEIRVPQKLARPLNPIRVTHRNAPPGFKVAETEQPERESGLTIGLDVTVRAPRRVFVRGQGIDAEFAGSVKVTGTVADPIADGRFELRRGDVSILSQRIALTRGDVIFAGSIEPSLDIAGEVRKADLTATVAVKGKATEPAITLSSTPTLPQDEIMARLLFGKSVQQLSAFEAAQLAAAVARWSGLSTGPDIIDRLRSALGIDALNAVTDTGGGTAVSAGTYVGSGVYVGLVQGADATSGRATVEIDVSDNVKLRGEASPSGGTKVGVVAEWEY